MQDIKEGTVVVASYSLNPMTSKPFEELFEFGYVSGTGHCVVFQQGCRGMQDAAAFKPEQIRIASEDEIKNLPWGR